MSEEEILALIKRRLRLNIKTESVYTGDYEGPMYETRHTIQLLLGDEVISEESL